MTVVKNGDFRIRLVSGQYLADWGSLGAYGCGVEREHAGVYDYLEAVELQRRYAQSPFMLDSLIEADGAGALLTASPVPESSRGAMLPRPSEGEA